MPYRSGYGNGFFSEVPLYSMSPGRPGGSSGRASRVMLTGSKFHCNSCDELLNYLKIVRTKRLIPDSLSFWHREIALKLMHSVEDCEVWGSVVTHTSWDIVGDVCVKMR